MCGIAGILDFQGRANSIDLVKSMLRSLSYRGPDESGIFHSPFATIGNVRLSIIDIEGGQQPISDASGRFWIVFNGEIFNYKELRKDLEKKSISFRTESDTEVLVQLFATYGMRCLDLINGQFAFAIWDRHKEELFIARDRVGIRPLFYNISNGILSFASEIKALFQLKSLNRELSHYNLSQAYTFWSTISPNTAFKDIYELPPGNFAVFNQDGFKTERYWQLSFNDSNHNLSVSGSLEKFDELLSSAVRLRLRADVKVAAYLSGGIDSSATVAYIKKIEPAVLNTFSIGFSDKEFDESSYQEEAVRYFNTNHKSISCASSEIAKHFPDVVRHSETPLLRTAPAPMMMLSRLVRDNGIKVVITGEGADEMLAGYNIFREAKIRRFWASQPDSKTRPLLLKRIYSNIPHLRDASPNILRMFFGYQLDEVDNPFYSHMLRWNNSHHIKKHFNTDIKESINGYDPLTKLSEILPPGFASWDQLEKAQWLETTIFMSGYLLSSQGDRMGMANSIEGRYPFLDHRLIEFCASLPPDYKLKGLNEKYLLKELMKGKIPESIRKRPKQPYRAPISSVFLGKNVPDYVGEMLSHNVTKRTGIFDYESVTTLLKKIERAGTASEMDNMALTAIISTHLLHHQFIEGNNSQYDRPPLNNLRVIDETKLVE